VQVARHGRTAVAVCSTAFESLGRAQARALGEPGLPMLVIPHPFGTRSRDEVRAMAVRCVDELIAHAAGGAGTAASPADSAAAAAPSSARMVEVSGGLDAVQLLIRERGWGDGLPVVPPTLERVERMLACTPRARSEVVAGVAPAFGVATVEGIAINAVLAGCDPQALPLLVAAVEAIADPIFNLQAIQATTNPVAVWLVVNGPAAQSLGVNAGWNCLGQGTWANATLGRALRLVLQNIGGAHPGGMDRATHGQPGKYSLCCAENEAESPWPALHVERGFAPGQSTVTVVGAEGTMNMNIHTKDPGELLRSIAQTMIHPPSNEYTHGGEPWIVFGPEHARLLAAAGYDKDAVRAVLWEQSRMRADMLPGPELARTRTSRRAELGEIAPDSLLPIAPRPQDIRLLVAGGAGTHSVYVPSFGNTRAVTRAFEPAA